MPSKIPENVYLLLGKENYLKRDFINGLKKTFLKNDTSGLNFDIFSPQDSNAKEVVETAYTHPFNSQTRLIIVKDAEKFSSPDKDTFLSYSKKPSDKTRIIFETSSSSKDNFIEELKKNSSVYNFEQLKEKEFLSWIIKRISNSGKKIEPDAAKALSEMIDYNLEIASNELDKLITYAGRRGMIVKKDIEALISKPMKETAFNFLDAISKRKYAAAFKVGVGVCADRKKFIELMGLLGWHTKRLWKIKSFLKAKKDSFFIAKELGIHDYIAKKLISDASNFSENEIKKLLAILLKVDRLAKSSPSNGPRDFLELLVSEISVTRPVRDC